MVAVRKLASQAICAGLQILAIGALSAAGAEAVPHSSQPPSLPAISQPAAVPASEMVVEVRIVGNKHTPEERLMRLIKTRPGRPYSAETVGQDVVRLTDSGLVLHVRPQYQDAPNGQGKVVVFEVSERPTIGYVKYVGNRISKKTLEKEAKLKTGDALDPFAIEEARRRIEAFYKKKGFPKANVSLFEGSRPTDEGVVFLINEGSKQSILWTSFEGNSIATDARLRTQIKSKQGILWIFGGELDRKQIDLDKERLESYYHSLGFFRARIGCTLEEHQFSDKRDWISLKFVIDEGPRYAVRNLSIVGNEKIVTEDLQALLKLTPGEPFNQDRMTEGENAIKDRYGAVGYVFADVKPEIRFLEEPGQLDLVYKITEGERYRVGKIEPKILGDYPHTQITTMLNRMSLQPGDIVDTRELRNSQRRLRSSQLFKVDPAMGVVPDIAFSPPTPEDIERAKIEFARRQSPTGSFRGQQDPADADSRPPEAQPSENIVRYQYSADWGKSTPSLPPYGAEWRTQASPTPVAGTPAAAQPPVVTQPQAVAQPQANQVQPPTTTYVQPPAVTQPPPATYVQPPAVTQPPTTTYAQPPAGNYVQPPATTYVQPPAVTQPPPATYAQSPAGNDVQPPPGTYVQPPPGQLPPPASAGSAGQPGSFFPDFGLFGDRYQGAMVGTPPDQEPLIDLPLVPTGQETETGRFMFSAGINSEAGLIGSIVVDEQNFDWQRAPRSWADIRNGTAFRGRGQRFRVEAMPGTEVQRYMVTFTEPYLLDSQVSLNLNGFYYTRFYNEWDEQRIGGRAALGYALTHDLSVSGAVRYAHVTISDPILGAPPDLLDALGESDLYGFMGQLTHDTRDSTFLPTEGHLLSMSFEQVLGTYQYPRAEIDFRKYFMLHERPDGSGRHVLSVKGTTSYTGDNTPIYEHYFAGGFSTIRGFRFREASPRVGGVVVGGEYSVLASAEYMFPITANDMVRGVVFCDTGAVQPTIDNWQDRYRVAPGFGLRITIPAMGPAPIALDFAFPIVKEDGDREQIFSFFIGFLR
jgi:outer membrane protein insertion porin family